MVHQPLPQRQSLQSWLGGSCGEARETDAAPTGIFDWQPLDEGFFQGVGLRVNNDGMQAAVEQSIIQAAIDQSKADEQLSRVMQQAIYEEEARQLKIALALSQQEDRELQLVTERSRASSAVPTQPVVEILSSDDETDVAVTSFRADTVDGSSLYGMGFSEGESSLSNYGAPIINSNTDSFFRAAAVKHAIQVANGNLDEALELLLTAVEPPSTDLFDDDPTNPDHQNEADVSDDDMFIAHDARTSGHKRPRPAADGTILDADSTNAMTMTGSADGIGHIFVDQSNISASEADIPAIDWIISNGLSSFHERVVVGSQTEAVGRGRHEQAWKALGYSAHFQQKRASQPESFVDESLVAHVQRALLRHSPEGRIIILVTGDMFLFFS
jgi:hypothetical protein